MFAVWYLVVMVGIIILLGCAAVPALLRKKCEGCGAFNSLDARECTRCKAVFEDTKSEL